ncbi:MAG TPA: hypothetical protein VFK04_20495 [Gemmatimonadaceae bacterium]|nr:hypothetical protein [Gemmatimonadaceae bacterium]
MTRSRSTIFSRVTSVAVAALLVMFSVSCSSDLLPTGPSSQASQPQQVDPLLGLPLEGILDGLGGATGSLGQILTCKPQPYAYDSKVIGPWGGMLRVGKHTFYVPPGALDSYERITAEAPQGTSISVRFKPEGLKFDRRHEPVLTLDYSDCGLVRTLLPKRIAYTDERLSILSILQSLDNIFTQRVSARIEHFSRYAIAF